MDVLMHFKSIEELTHIRNRLIYFDVGILLEEDLSSFFLSFRPLVRGFEQEVTASDKQFRTSAPIGKAERRIGLARLFAF